MKRSPNLFLFYTLLVAINFQLFSACKKPSDMLPGGNLTAEYTEQGTITVKNNRVTICVWDYGKIDNDIIDLFINGKQFLKEYMLTANKECFDVNLSDGENWIGIVALDEGFVFPATVHVEISDGISAQDFEIEAYIKKAGGYKIKVQK